jgi:hypothetical protein
MAKTFNKDPNATLDYIMDWRPALTPWLALGESIINVVWTIPAPLAEASSSNTADDATAFISGGTEGTRYEVACKITTDAGRIDERSFYLNITNQFA